MKDYMLDPPELPEFPECPKCHSTLYKEVYIGDDGVCGCDACVRIVDVWDWMEELEENRE